jgi:hypothetical protein
MSGLFMLISSDIDRKEKYEKLSSGLGLTVWQKPAR